MNLDESELRRGRGRPKKNGGMYYQTMIRYGEQHKQYLDSLSRELGKSNNDIFRIALVYYYNAMKEGLDLH